MEEVWLFNVARLDGIFSKWFRATYIFGGLGIYLGSVFPSSLTLLVMWKNLFYYFLLSVQPIVFTIY